VVAGAPPGHSNDCGAKLEGGGGGQRVVHVREAEPRAAQPDRPLISRS
jgi:hypothetical protein